MLQNLTLNQVDNTAKILIEYSSNQNYDVASRLHKGKSEPGETAWEIAFAKKGQGWLTDTVKHSN